MGEIVQMIGASFVLVMGTMTVLWLFYMVQKNAGIVDIGWTLGFALTALVFTFLSEGFWLRRWLLGGMILIWSLRLTSYLFGRFLKTEEDPRYQALKDHWGENNLDFKVLGMFLFQGLLVIILSIGFLIPMSNLEPSLGWWELTGTLIWLIGVLGETAADQQLRMFKNVPDNQGKVCDVGLWRYSRHPNYFFECIVWIAYAVFSFGSPWGWLVLYAPLVMFILILRISGIPLAEAQALKTKGEAYAAYQRRTSSFIPWFPG